ncbi:MAG: proton-conducting transporter membrane subunit [Gillisia sp.]
MQQYLYVLILIPLLGFIVSLLIPKKNEVGLSRTAITTTGLNLFMALTFSIYWLINGRKSFNLYEGSLYKGDGYNFFIDLFFDQVSVAFLLVGTILTFMIVKFSTGYLHRESGYKRYFNNILFFYLGYLVVVLAGNFETMFIGWEILGLASFLLIAFYRLRYLPVKNAIKVFSIYRIGDVGMLLAMWMSHHLWHENITFQALNNYDLVQQQLISHSGMGIFISLMLLLAAIAKSAQLPFSSWLPRAMEGPTPSSAIFYGALSVHMGAFLLLRTYPFWEHQIFFKWLVVSVGLFTFLITNLISRVQTTIKGKVAYSSASQIGIIFIEIAAGFEWLALIHFAGNAFLRSYQLLISPSVVSYMIREQFFTFQKAIPKSRPNKKYLRLKQGLFLLSLKEWHLETLIFRLVFKPLKRLRELLNFLTRKIVLWILIPFYLIGMYMAYFYESFYQPIKYDLALFTAFIALLMVSKSYNERSSSRLAWILSVSAHFFIFLAITFNEHFNSIEATIYLSGILISGIIGYVCLQRLKKLENHPIGLNQFHGHITRHPTLGLVFLLSCLGVAGFPITSAFLGEDLILTHIEPEQWLLAALFSFTFIVNGIAVIRMYARIFLGNSENSFQTSRNLTI